MILHGKDHFVFTLETSLVEGWLFLRIERKDIRIFSLSFYNCCEIRVLDYEKKQLEFEYLVEGHQEFRSIVIPEKEPFTANCRVTLNPNDTDFMVQFF
jgi:hypothetical protein